MILSKRCTYGIRSLLQLVSVYPNGSLTIKTIAEKEEIPRKFLEQVMLQLNNAGLLHSKKGRDGGYALQKAPQAITLLSIIEVLDGALIFTECMEIKPKCRRAGMCKLNVFAKETQAMLLGYFSKISLQDLHERSCGGEGQQYSI